MEHAKKMADFLGMKESKITPNELIKITRQGIRASLLKKLFSLAHINQEEFSDFSGIKIRTLVRRFQNTNEKLTPEETEKALRFVRIFFEAVDVFGNEEKAVSWLKKPNRALNHEFPFSLLDSDLGAEQVMAVLNKIRHGVYS